MNDADRDAIQDLFARLRAAEAANPTRDPAAEAYIRDRLEQHPAAAYYMAQTVIAQEHALRAARDRIAAAEGDDGRYAPPAEQQRGGGGFFGNLFGGGDRRPLPQRPGPWEQPAQAIPGGMLARGAGGGFLAGAAQTAVGVAGGMMLGNMLTDLFEGDRHEGHQSFADTDGGLGGGQGLGDFGGGSAGFGDDGAGGFFDDRG